VWRSYSIRLRLSTFSVVLFIHRFHRGPCKIETSHSSAISQPILTKFGTLTAHGNTQQRWNTIFDIASLADIWAIFPKFCITGIGQLFFFGAIFVKFTHVVANCTTNIRCELKKIDLWEITFKRPWTLQNTPPQFLRNPCRYPDQIFTHRSPLGP